MVSSPTPSVFSSLKGKKFPFFSFVTVLLTVVVLRLTFVNNSITSQFFSDYFSSSFTKTSKIFVVTPLSIPHSDLVPVVEERENGSYGIQEAVEEADLGVKWEICSVWRGINAAHYIPCLDNVKAIKKLKNMKRMENRERHCPEEAPRCLVPLPEGYRAPILWPKSRDKIWYNNIPRPKLVEYKKKQNWVQISGEYLVFPGGGTQFTSGVSSYIHFIEKTLPSIEWGKRTRVVLDIGCGVASFGGYLLDRNVITMSVAPKDEHEAQIQFGLERGIPAVLSVIATKRLPFSDNVFDAIHCARCRVHWYEEGGKPLLELNRILRPGGFFIWSATPVYRLDKENQDFWKEMVALTGLLCWKTVVKSALDSNGIGLVVYQKPFSNSCYMKRKENKPPLCDENSRNKSSWYAPLDDCIPKLPIYNVAQKEDNHWPRNWPQRLVEKPESQISAVDFKKDGEHWNMVVSNQYLQDFGIKWSGIRNVMDMNAGYGGFAAALIKQPLWVMNVVPVTGRDTLPIIFGRGLIGIYHDWCEAFNTYPRTYDLLHSSHLLGNLGQRCDVIDVAVEIDRILRPGGWVLVEDTVETIKKLRPVLDSLHWKISVHGDHFLVGRKGFWRPVSSE